MKTSPTLPVAAERAWNLWLWLEGRVADFPVHARHGVGQRILGTSLDLLDTLVRAAYSPRGSESRSHHLREANARLALLRLMLRGAHELRWISTAQHDHAMAAQGEAPAAARDLLRPDGAVAERRANPWPSRRAVM
jgi:hypothetical protein